MCHHYCRQVPLTKQGAGAESSVPELSHLRLFRNRCLGQRKGHRGLASKGDPAATGPPRLPGGTGAHATALVRRFSNGHQETANPLPVVSETPPKPGTWQGNGVTERKRAVRTEGRGSRAGAGRRETLHPEEGKPVTLEEPRPCKQPECRGRISCPHPGSPETREAQGQELAV